MDQDKLVPMDSFGPMFEKLNSGKWVQPPDFASTCDYSAGSNCQVTAAVRAVMAVTAAVTCHTRP
jgi:hypothetical protein